MDFLLEKDVLLEASAKLSGSKHLASTESEGKVDER